MKETSDESMKTSRETVSDWLSYCREVCINWCKENESKDTIGGEGIVVQVDESKIGKRKYNRGRMTEGTWLFGMVEIVGNSNRKGGAFRVEICKDNKRDADTLIPLIKEHVKIGTTIYSDEWKAYYMITQNGYEHRTVNHSKEFISDGTHTQTIENRWKYLKSNIVTHARGDIATHIAEYLWRRHVLINKLQKFEYFIETIKVLYRP